jgi:hypothetical protein
MGGRTIKVVGNEATETITDRNGNEVVVSRGAFDPHKPITAATPQSQQVAPATAPTGTPAPAAKPAEAPAPEPAAQDGGADAEKRTRFQELRQKLTSGSISPDEVEELNSMRFPEPEEARKKIPNAGKKAITDSSGRILSKDEINAIVSGEAKQFEAYRNGLPLGRKGVIAAFPQLSGTGGEKQAAKHAPAEKPAERKPAAKTAKEDEDDEEDKAKHRASVIGMPYFKVSR